jgi:RNA polymerase sigma-70 factor (ECF subfamily)
MPERSEPDWSELIEKYGPLVWRTVSRLVSHEADAADCFQETFVAAWSSAGREAIEHWPGFLKSVATTTALKRLRERYRQPRGGLPDVPATGAVGADSHVETEATELAEHLRQALAELDPRQAEVFCLICLEGASYAEAAGQLGLTETNVGVILSRARQRLRAHLKEFAPFQPEITPARAPGSESR